MSSVRAAARRDAALLVPVRRGGRLAASGSPIAEAELQKLLRVTDRPGEPGRVIPVPNADGFGSILLVGIGAGRLVDLRRAGAAAGKAARAVGRLAVLPPDGTDCPDPGALIAEAAALATYRFRVPGAAESATRPAGRLSDVVVIREGPAAGAQDLSQLSLGLRATWLARDLANTPSLDKSPEWLAATAQSLAGPAGLEVTVRREEELAAQGFGGLLGVGAGSARPPRLIELRYRPAPTAARHVVLVGKGITFDSGGLDLKPLTGMMMMKTDMAGAGAVLAATSLLAEAGVTCNVTALLAAAENLPSGSALRPGDVIRHYDGRTVEVWNTDAEGRLVLADAIGYAVRNLRPDVIVDAATLTGAATLALGRRYAAMYATDDALAAELMDAGSRADEGLWRMPLVNDYRVALDSDVADLRNIADPEFGFSAGSVVAALFLREFTGGLPWAHLDIAGPARAEADDAELTKGATGFGARTLLYWLANS